MSEVKYNLYIRYGDHWQIDRIFDMDERQFAMSEARNRIDNVSLYDGVRLTREVSRSGLLHEVTLIEDEKSRSERESSGRSGTSDDTRSKPSSDPVTRVASEAATVVTGLGRPGLMQLTAMLSGLSVVALGFCFFLRAQELFAVPDGLMALLMVGTALFPVYWFLGQVFSAEWFEDGKREAETAAAASMRSQNRNRRKARVRRAPLEKAGTPDTDGFMDIPLPSEGVAEAKGFLDGMLSVIGAVSDLAEHEHLPAMLYLFGAFDEIEREYEMDVGQTDSILQNSFGKGFADSGYEVGLRHHEHAINAGRFAWKTGRGSEESLREVLPELIHQWPHEETGPDGDNGPMFCWIGPAADGASVGDHAIEDILVRGSGRRVDHDNRPDEDGRAYMFDTIFDGLQAILDIQEQRENAFAFGLSTLADELPDNSELFLAFQLANAAEPGGVLASRALYLAVSGSPAFVFNDLSHIPVGTENQLLHTYSINIHDIRDFGILEDPEVEVVVEENGEERPS